NGVADLMAYRLISMNLRAEAEPMRVYGALVSSNFFEFLGVTPVIGRGFRQDEAIVPGRDAVVVISHEFWTRAFGADRGAIGRTVALNGQPFTIIGVTPAAFHGPAASVRLDVYAPVTMQPAVLSGHRLRPAARAQAAR